MKEEPISLRWSKTARAPMERSPPSTVSCKSNSRALVRKIFSFKSVTCSSSVLTRVVKASSAVDGAEGVAFSAGAGGFSAAEPFSGVSRDFSSAGLSAEPRGSEDPCAKLAAERLAAISEAIKRGIVRKEQPVGQRPNDTTSYSIIVAVLSVQPPFFNSVRTSFATAFRVSKTPTPVGATA